MWCNKHLMTYSSVLPLIVLLFLVSFSACHDDFPDDEAGDLPSEIRLQPDGAPMRLVPAGAFLMGTSDVELQRYLQEFPYRTPQRFANEQPQHEVYLAAFYIDKYEVTNLLFERFLQETGHEARYLDRPPYNQPDLPAIVLDWEDAVAYAKWAGKRLPTEAEWEKAARGADARIWPWGDEWDPTRLNANDATG